MRSGSFGGGVQSSPKWKMGMCLSEQPRLGRRGGFDTWCYEYSSQSETLMFRPGMATAIMRTVRQKKKGLCAASQVNVTHGQVPYPTAGIAAAGNRLQSAVSLTNFKFGSRYRT
jgi:hypothetical protein